MVRHCYFIVVFWIVVGTLSCTDSPNEPEREDPLFSIVSPRQSGLDFVNRLEEDENFHYYNYIYSYNGGGVALADFDNDGLDDLFFTANTNDNKLYHNKGNFVFEDITSRGGITQQKGFDTGVSVADVNGDGWLDIYVCRAGWFTDDAPYANLLFINQGNLTFKEEAEKYGLAGAERSIAATFFDYDRDGDLDVYVCNSPVMEKRAQRLVDLKNEIDPIEAERRKGSDKLYDNDGNGHFSDVSQKAGIAADIGFGLNPQVGDLDQDGWLDIYVSNDFEMPDFAYRNNGDGTFTDIRDSLVKHMSFYSMGSDIADIDNDGLDDLVVLDMNPEDYVRSKTTMGMTSIPKFWEMVGKGYGYQYMHNMLQRNNGNGTFSELGQLAGVAYTDWSWSALLADFDLDGHKDLYVTNGIFRDVLDKDTNNKIKQAIRDKGTKPTNADFLRYTRMLPQQKLHNYFFRNNGDLTFSNRSNDWVAERPTYSNGAAYGDLDNDGDLDLVVNNINEEATLLRNNAMEHPGNSYLKVRFKGPNKNRFGSGARVRVLQSNGVEQVGQLINNRGYLSAMPNQLHFGMPDSVGIESLQVSWPDGSSQVIGNISPNHTLEVSYADAVTSKPEESAKARRIFEEVPFPYAHKDTVFDDFQIQLLLPHKLSQLGPGVAKTDINGDSFDDLYLGGGCLQLGKLLTANTQSLFSDTELMVHTDKDERYEDTGATFFDADGDGDQDLYVVSGSYEFAQGSPYFRDRLYRYENGRFKECKDCLPEIYSSAAVVAPMDFDGDGDMDLFVGGRVVPGKYPNAPQSYLLENSEGIFKNRTKVMAPNLEHIGMVTDALWNDLDDDGDPDLVVTGEWMGIEVFENDRGAFRKNERYRKLSMAKGWWNRLLIADINRDGIKDIVAGNLGLNYKYHASSENPFHSYTNDFDANGTEDIVLAKNYGDKKVPIRGKGCTAQQMPFLAQKIKTYQEFASLDVEGIVGEGIVSALHLTANEFRSGIFYGEPEGGYLFKPFANAVQVAPVTGILYDDFDGDTVPDLLLAGNNYQAEIETTRADAGTGVFLKGLGKGGFQIIPNRDTGLFADGDVRNLLLLQTPKGKAVLVVNNNALHRLFSVKD